MKRYLQILAALCCLPILLISQNAVTAVSDTLMVPVPGGTLQLGSTTGEPDELPVHSVTLSSFKIDRFEITYEKWTEVRVWALTHGYSGTDIPWGKNGSDSARTNNPVTEVNWYDAVKWCNARSEKDGLTPVYYTDNTQSTVYRTGHINITADAVKWTANGYRLPTESEWEFAALGGMSTHGYTYSGSNTSGEVAWNYANSGNTTHQVGTKASNELGIYDMSGNVWEWCWDWFGPYSSAPQSDPKGATSGSNRVLRGGCFDGNLNGFNYCRVAFRDYNGKSLRYDWSGGLARYNTTGFRCVQASVTHIGSILPPTNLTAFAGNASITLKWNKNSEIDFLKYRIYIGSDSTTMTLKDSTSTSIADTSKIITELTNEIKYYFRVTAIDSLRFESGKSTSVNATPSLPVLNEMVQVEGGSFTAGTTLTTISSFNMDKYEVTYDLWTAVRTWALTHGYTDLVAGQNGYNPVGTNNPVTMVNWYEIVKWCNARSEMDGLTPVYYTSSTQTTVYRTGENEINTDAVKWTANGYRLPTEAEWEFAARGGTQTLGYTYSGSNNQGDVAWYSSNSGNTTHTVGQKTSNELGIADMTGNVWEWCWDWYSGVYPTGGTTDPKGPSSSITERLLRGGSFTDDDPYDRVTARYVVIPPTGSGISVGFRCAMTKTEIVIDTNITWRLQLKSFAGTSVDNDNFLGIAKSATDGFDQVFDSPKPPAPVGNYAQIYFSHPEWAQLTGDNYAQDIRLERALGDTTLRWKFEVKTNFDTTVRIDFVSDGRIPDKFKMLLKDFTAGTRTFLKTGAMSYSFKSGTGTNIRKFEILIGDSTAPTIKVLKPNGGEIVRSAKSYAVSYSVVDKSGIDSSVVSYSTNSGALYTKAGTVTGNSSAYLWTAPPLYLNYQGSIKVTATDSMGNSSSDVSDHLFTIVGDSLANAFPGGWSLTGLPLKPFDSTSIKIFGDDIVQSFYQYEYTPSGGYLKSSMFAPGRGYWLGLLSNVTADVVGAPLTDSVSVALLKGFNLITNPLVVPVPKDSLKFRAMGVVKKYADALAANWIVTGLQTYRSGSYVNQDTLQLWNGYWFGVQQDNVEMLVYPPIMNGVPAPNSLPKELVVSPTDWIVNIIATYGAVSDQLLRFGVKPDATVGFDSKYDEPKAPAPPAGKYVEAYFTKTWQPLFGNKFNADIRDPQSLQSWTFSVVPSDSGSVTLAWKCPVELPATVSLILKDGMTSIDMKKDSSYTISTKSPRDLTINAVTTSVRKPENAPSQFELSQNYPNPFNPSTTLSYALPQDSWVRIGIYNVLGQRIAELVNAEQSAGWYQVSWNAEVTSGIYFYRMEAVSRNDANQRFIDVKKMILMR